MGSEKEEEEEEEEEERVQEEEEEMRSLSLFPRIRRRRKNWKRKENCFLTSLSLSAGCRSLHGSHCF